MSKCNNVNHDIFYIDLILITFHSNKQAIQYLKKLGSPFTVEEVFPFIWQTFRAKIKLELAHIRSDEYQIVKYGSKISIGELFKETWRKKCAIKFFIKIEE